MTVSMLIALLACRIIEKAAKKLCTTGATRNSGTGERRFAASEDANVAACVLSGMKLSFAMKTTRPPTPPLAWLGKVILHNQNVGGEKECRSTECISSIIASMTHERREASQSSTLQCIKEATGTSLHFASAKADRRFLGHSGHCRD